jgi:hypothetical protein
MLSPRLLDHRLAFLLLAALYLGTAVPLAFGWVRLFPEEAPPFQIHRPPTRRWSIYAHSSEDEENPRDPLAMVLLICVTVSYAAQFPGLPRSLALGSIPTVVPQDASGWARFALTWFLVMVPGIAAVYSLLRPNFLRVPLIAAGVLILLLWLLRSASRRT